MKSLNLYFFLLILVIGGSCPFQNNEVFSKSLSGHLFAMSCPNTCQLTDSLALVALYNSTNGPTWTNTWNLSTPVCSWTGVTLDNNGFVNVLNLNANNLGGTLPNEVGDFSRLESIRVDNNNIGGSIPNSIGNLSLLEIAFLDNNNFTGSIPETMGNLSNLITVFLDNNELSGTLPATFNNLTGLTELHINSNNIDSLPDLSGMTALQIQNKRFRIKDNELTFDDIIVQGPSAVNMHYDPQDSVFTEMNVTIATGTSYTIDLGFDSGVSTNIYQWYKDGLPFGAPLTTNKLTFDPVVFAHAGEYRCQVTNTDFTQLTLHTRPVTINVICGTSVLNVDETLCEGDFRIYNGVTYDVLNPTGTEDLTGADQYGCDSSIVINLSFQPENIVNINDTVCPEDTIFVGGVAYHTNNPSGTEVFTTGDQFGCDSTVIIDLSFYPTPAEGIISQTICPGDSLLVNGVYLTANNPDSIFHLDNASFNGCDSIVNASINFYPIAMGSETINLCTGGEININGIIFNASNTNDIVLFENGSQNGCDSTSNISINFIPPSTNNINSTLCTGQSILVNGVTYDELNPVGTEILSGQNYLGCDSIVNINLSFNSTVQEDITETFCPGSSIIVNGETYDELNPVGTETLIAGSINGCDSIININLSFFPEATGIENSTLCPGQSITVNGEVYNESNPSGTEVITNGSFTGCDSTVTIDLSFSISFVETIDDLLCPGEFITVNGEVYNESNPSGTEVFTSGSATGCDSTIIIDLTFAPPAVNTIDDLLCPGEFITVNSEIYDQSNPNGTEVIPNGSFTGCDSTIIINLSFYTPVSSSMTTVLCPGESIIVNGITYNEDNPNGTETLTNGSITGCDSTVVIDLEFHPPAIEDLTLTICPEDTIYVGSIAYHAGIPTGTTVLPNASLTGCDSTVNVDLSFFEPAVGELIQTLCPEQAVFINGTIYNESNPFGIEEFPNATANGCDSVLVINLTFNNIPEFTIDSILCPGENITINGVIYDQDNPTGVQFFENEAANGCDSTVFINLSYHSSFPTLVETTLCPGDSIIVNGTTYNFFNPSGFETLPGASYTGCDSLVEINVLFFDAPSSTVATTLCADEEMIINGVTYDINNPNGTEMFSGSSTNGCDSVVLIDLTFLTPPTNNIIQTLCPGESLFINNTTYDQSNPSGTEVIENAAANGCDSTIIIDLSFSPAVNGSLNTSICVGDTIFINGTAYHEGNSTGSELFPNAAVNGCDSTLIIDLDVLQISSGIFSSTICPGDTILINGEAFHAGNSTGTQILENAAFNGCDSIIEVSIDFYPIPTGDFNTTICLGDTLFFNGTAYHQANTSGSEVLPNSSINGCDSIVEVNIDFHAVSTGDLITTICPGDTLFYNGTAYHENNSSGSEILSGTSITGCDSTVSVQVNFYPASASTFAPSLCNNETVMINGNIYDQDNPSGTEILQSANGCDSTINIDINFISAVTFDTSAIICQGEVFLLADQTFSESGSYDITLESASATGCDSIIQVALEVQTVASLGAAQLGDDIIQCDQDINLNANQPEGTTGMWTSLDEMNISNPHDNTLQLSNLAPGWNTFIWTLSSDQCINYDSDTIAVLIADIPQANDDSYILNVEDNILEFDLFENDIIDNVDAFIFELTSNPQRGQLTLVEEGIYTYPRLDIREDQVTFDYLLCNEDCPDLCDSATVTINIAAQSIEDLDIPNAITPNGDDVNEFFMFPQLEYFPDQYPDKELIIFNRWGDIVYEAKPYLNDWYGQDKSGKALPQGTYYYVLRLDINNAVILKGDVSILK